MVRSRDMTPSRSCSKETRKEKDGDARAAFFEPLGCDGILIGLHAAWFVQMVVHDPWSTRGGPFRYEMCAVCFARGGAAEDNSRETKGSPARES